MENKKKSARNSKFKLSPEAKKELKDVVKVVVHTAVTVATTILVNKGMNRKK